jgi:hypothetical protein
LQIPYCGTVNAIRKVYSKRSGGVELNGTYLLWSVLTIKIDIMNKHIGYLLDAFTEIGLHIERSKRRISKRIKFNGTYSIGERRNA